MSVRALRGALRSALGLLCFAPALVHPASDGGIDPATAVVVLLLWLYGGVRSTLSELDPLEEEGFLAKRIRRLVLLPVGMALGGAALFPLLTTWPYVWFVLALATGLQRFGFVAEVAVGVTWLVSLGACAQVLLDPYAAWVLGPVLVLWFVLPGLDRYADAEGRRRSPPSPAPLLRAGAIVAAAVFALTLAIAFVLPDPFPALAAAPELATTSGKTTVPKLPLAQILLGGLLLGGMWVVAQRLSRAAAEKFEPPPPLDMQVELESSALPGERGAFSWATSPRRAAVEAYLAHRHALVRRGATRDPALTPQQWAATLPEGPSPEVAASFAKARWSTDPVTEAEVERLRGWIREVEGLDFKHQEKQRE